MNAATFSFGIAFTAMFFGSYLLLTELWGYSTLRAGLGISPGPALVGILAPRFGRLAGRIGQRPLLVTGGLLFAASGVWRYVAITETPRYLADYLPGMLLSGLGVALCFPQMASTTAQSLPPNRLGVGGGVNQAIRQLGGTLGVALTIAFLTTGGASLPGLAAFDRVAILIVAGGLLTTLLCLPLRTRPVTSTAGRPEAELCTPARRSNRRSPSPTAPSPTESALVGPVGRGGGRIRTVARRDRRRPVRSEAVEATDGERDGHGQDADDPGDRLPRASSSTSPPQNLPWAAGNSAAGNRTALGDSTSLTTVVHPASPTN